MTDRYSKPAIILHWLVAIGIIINLKYGLSLDDLPKDQVGAVIALHKSIGITVLGLVVLRVLWRVGHKPPALPGALQPWERKLSTGTHHLLYLLMALIPLSGWIMDAAWKGGDGHPLMLFNTVPFYRPGIFQVMAPATREQADHLLGAVHSAAAWLLMAALALHILGALKHQVLDGQKELQRMWFGK